MKTYTGAQLLRILLERQGIHTIAGIPGGAILPFYDALHGGGIRHILARHEQGAGFIAQGMARATGRAAVCVATSGPGATNLLTAIADARLDSVPLVAITGQVPQPLIGTDAFQEVDTYGLTLPITKHNFLVRSAAELLEVVPLAFQIAESGRPGPVAIDVPKDVLNATLAVEALPPPGRPASMPRCPDTAIEELAAQLTNAQRPVLYLGGGVIGAGAAELARTLARRLNAPVVSTLMALGAMDADDPLHMGMLGMHGGKGTNLLLHEADFLLAIGARFDDRATGKAAEFCPHASIAHIDIDRAEIGKIKRATLGLTGDAADILRRLLAQLPDSPQRPHWRRRAAELREEHPLHCPPRAEDPLHPVNLIRFIGEQLPSDAIITTDVGQHQMWVAQAYPFRQPRTLLTSGGLGTMGFGLPAAIGAALALDESEGGASPAHAARAEPDRLAAPELSRTADAGRSRRVVCISGDGSILMNIQELATLAELALPVAIIVLNNANLGLVRQQQELFYGQRYAASRLEHAPDFAALARSFGLRGVRLDPRADPLAQLAEALNAPGPCLIDVPIEDAANVYPMVPPGAANHETIIAPELALT
ncbi:MAG TPA: thiamine pyrophosphate-dependent enzyme [Opitutaceae bacterium]|nr:thiamine pyrophosphate-dependent enzyme [Opitutaceae bacterium]